MQLLFMERNDPFGKVGLMVDEVIGQQQIVIKNISNVVRQDNKVSGAAILGDGVVSLIIDVNTVIDEIFLKRIQEQESESVETV